MQVKLGDSHKLRVKADEPDPPDPPQARVCVEIQSAGLHMPTQTKMAHPDPFATPF